MLPSRICRLSIARRILSRCGTTTAPASHRLMPSPALMAANVNKCAQFSHIHTSSARHGIVQFMLSDIGEGIAEVQVKEWHVAVGDHVSQFDNLCEVQSDKASVTITSRYDGRIVNIHHPVDDMARVGHPLVDIEIEGDVEEGAKEAPTKKVADDTPPATPTHQSAPAEVTSGNDVKSLAAPAVRRIAMENNVKITDVRGTGRDGRVLKEDIMAHIEGPKQTTKGVQSVGEDTVVPIKGYTRAMVKTMTESNKIPHFGYNDEVNVDRLVDLREQLKVMATKRGEKMSYMPLFIKAASMALLEYPILNATIDATVDNVIYKASHNICVAIDTPGGLVVPNIKNCQHLNLWEIAAELRRLQADAVKQSLKPSDLTGGTFTLSNIGSIGGTYAHPLIFPPQVAIGALTKITKEPRYNSNDELVAQRLVRVSWCADHRVIDGATMARFSNVWKEYLEQPGLMIAQMR